MLHVTITPKLSDFFIRSKERTVFLIFKNLFYKSSAQQKVHIKYPYLLQKVTV